MKFGSASFFPTTPATPAQAATTPGDLLKKLQCDALWTRYRLHQAAPGCFYFLGVDSETDRHPVHGFYSLKEAKQFIRARDSERGY